MGRLKTIVLHMQQSDATNDAIVQQEHLLHVARPRECNSATEAELRRLVPLVTSHLSYFKTPKDHAEALENALQHPELTLPFWRGKAKQLGLEDGEII
jgi:hypothetical protein